mmetsp:Transcript_62735/g.161440  ORF Transcript_62735/g.161440 Transcript_62735/m.161440 type:complete len:458 (+) Transcript_62735:933-2306(+)
MVVTQALHFRAEVGLDSGCVLRELMLQGRKPGTLYPDHLLQPLVEASERLLTFDGELFHADVDLVIPVLNVLVRCLEARLGVLCQHPDLVRGSLQHLRSALLHLLRRFSEARLDESLQVLDRLIQFRHGCVEVLLQLLVSSLRSLFQLLVVSHVPLRRLNLLCAKLVLRLLQGLTDVGELLLHVVLHLVLVLLPQGLIYLHLLEALELCPDVRQPGVEELRLEGQEVFVLALVLCLIRSFHLVVRVSKFVQFEADALELLLGLLAQRHDALGKLLLVLLLPLIQLDTMFPDNIQVGHGLLVLRNEGIELLLHDLLRIGLSLLEVPSSGLNVASNLRFEALHHMVQVVQAPLRTLAGRQQLAVVVLQLFSMISGLTSRFPLCFEHSDFGWHSLARQLHLQRWEHCFTDALEERDEVILRLDMDAPAAINANHVQAPIEQVGFLDALSLAEVLEAKVSL